MTLKMSFMVDGKQISIADVLFPIGYIYISTSNIDPGTYLGGTWERFSNGRTLVGVNESETEFNNVQKTGGSKDMQSHKHAWTGYYRNSGLSSGSNTIPVFGNDPYTLDNKGIQNAGTGNAGNLQPYITVYIWKRTA